jgi:hypothetical protein
VTSPVLMPAGHAIVAPDLDAYENATAAWSTWTPTLTNLTVSGGSLTSKYRQVGKTVDFRLKFVFGAGSAVGTQPQFSLPANIAADYAAVAFGSAIGGGVLLDSGVSTRPAFLLVQSATTLLITSLNATPVFTDITATVPFTWNAPDSIFVWGTYEAA